MPMFYERLEMNMPARPLILSSVLLLIVIIHFTKPLQCDAFNSATHVYIADQVANTAFPLTFDRTDFYYGSIAPDMALFADLSKWPYGFCETHYQFTRLPYAWWKFGQRAFAQGWQIHNEMKSWGADLYAHGTCESFENCVNMVCTYDGYVVIRASELADIYPVLKNYPDLAHTTIEVAIDLLLIDDWDPFLGRKLLRAALFRSSEVPKLLSKTPFSTDYQTLYSAEAAFRNLVTYYAFVLCLPYDYRMEMMALLAAQLAVEMEIPTSDINLAIIREILGAAKDLCRNTDYYYAIQSAIDGIINNKSNLIK